MKKILILDISSRLPGPMATALLDKDLFEVIKVEFSDFPDPFTSQELESVEPLFFNWYKNINKGKTISRVENIAEVTNFITDYTIVIAVGNLKDSKLEFLKKHKIHFIQILGAKESKHKYLHDLNALLLSETFSFNKSSAGPYLPFAGINFAQAIRARITETALKNPNEWTHQKIYLKDETIKTFDLLSGNNDQVNHLHNGKFPCYRLYKSKDKKAVAISCIEEHFWLNFCDVFNLKLTPKDRFDINNDVAEVISKLFGQYNGQELQDIVDTNKLLITIF